MNLDAMKAVSAQIPYRVYVLTAHGRRRKGNIASSTVNWVTQSAFKPPLVVVGIEADSGTYKVIKTA